MRTVKHKITEQDKIQDLISSAKKCQLCLDIVGSQQNPSILLGQGTLNTPVMIIGEAPGYVEDMTGVPMCPASYLIKSRCGTCQKFSTCYSYFLGNRPPSDGHVTCRGYTQETSQSALDKISKISKINNGGQLLENLLSLLQVPREKIFISNVVMCRPPSNRTPTDAEVKNCRYIYELIRIIKPKYIVTIGSVASKALLHKYIKMGDMVGSINNILASKVTGDKTDDYEITVVPCWHIAYPERLKKMKQTTKLSSVIWDIYEVLYWVMRQSGLLPENVKRSMRPPEVPHKMQITGAVCRCGSMRYVHRTDMIIDKSDHSRQTQETTFCEQCGREILRIDPYGV